MTETYEDESMEDLGIYIHDINVKPFMLEPMPESHDYNETNELLSSSEESQTEDTNTERIGNTLW